MQLPRSVYELWWEVTERCSETRAPLDHVRWQVTTASTQAATSETPNWVAADNRIIVPPAMLDDGPAIRHVMLHAILKLPANTHPHAQFARRCGGVVACDGACALTDDDSTVAPRQATTPDSIRVSVFILPERPLRSAYDGSAAILVEAHNPLGHRVRVQRQRVDQRWVPATFSYVLRGPSIWISNNVRLPFPDATWFEAGETKRAVFDVRIGAPLTLGGLPEGMLELTGDYESKDTSVRIVVGR